MPKLRPNQKHQKETHKPILIYLPEDELELFSNICGSYRRAKVIRELIRDYIGKHGCDVPLKDNNARKPINPKRKH